MFSPIILWESCYETASGTAASTTDDADKACASNGTADHTIDDLGSCVMFSYILVTEKGSPVSGGMKATPSISAAENRCTVSFSSENFSVSCISGSSKLFMAITCVKCHYKQKRI